MNGHVLWPNVKPSNISYALSCYPREETVNIKAILFKSHQLSILIPDHYTNLLKTIEKSGNFMSLT